MKIQKLGYLSALRIILVLIALSLISACSSLNTVSDVNSKSYTVTGYLVEEDGVTPIAGATVSIPSTDKQDLVSIAPIDANCAQPSNSFKNYTCSIEDGSFSITVSDITQLPLKLNVEFNGQSQEIVLGVDEISPDLGTLALNINAAAKESVAIVLDFYNPFEDIRDMLESNESDMQAVRHQLISEYQNIYNISSDENDIKFPTFYSLFIDEDMDGKADIHNYDTIYINSRSQNDIALLDQSLKSELAEYIANGGNLYITEWHIEVEVEEPGPEQFI